MENALESRRNAQEGNDYHAIRRNWFLGKNTLKEALLVALDAQAGGWHYGEEWRESAEAKIGWIVSEELERRRWAVEVLTERRKGDPGKIAMARRLREKTPLPMAWIPQRLNMDPKAHLAHPLHRQRRGR